MPDFDTNFWWTLLTLWVGFLTLAKLIEYMLEEQEKPHWSTEDWWVNRHLTRFDDLHDGDYPSLFTHPWDGYGDEPDIGNKETMEAVLRLVKEEQ